MKTILPYILFLLFFACQKKATVNQTADTVAKGRNDSAGVTTQQQRNDSLAQLHDSVAFEKILQTAIARALKHKEPRFTETFEDKSLTDSVTAYVSIRGGSWFDKSRKHVIITREAPWITYTDVFEISNGRLMPQVHNECAALAHINDSILETNGDGHNDFAVHWYPMSGCCTRDIYDVYVYRSKTHDFSAKYEFINPVFSPKEKIIRGVLYGHFAGLSNTAGTAHR